jgi:peptidoglycan/xylan/chitin deacetylase (PgdA/CDA1 family)
MYLVKTPWWLKAIYPSFVWNMPRDEKNIYLTFDDGPHETATPFVLDELKKYNAKATFFCIGKNVEKHPNIYQSIIDEGHAVGNHTFNHMNGWQNNDFIYIKNIAVAAQFIKSNLFRPPYGRIKKSQAKMLLNQSTTANQPPQIIMWDVLSGDFDTKLSPEKCLRNVLKNTGNGSIIVFHDSSKAWERMSYALPKLLEHFSKEGYSFRAIAQ